MSEVPPAQCRVTITRPPAYSLTIDLGDVVDLLTITNPLINNGVKGAHLSIPNFAGAYNGLILQGDDIQIWLSRDAGTLGTDATRAFSGRIVNPKRRGDGYGSFFIDLDCHGYAFQLGIPPALLRANYAAVNGRAIIEAALALCPLITRHLTDSMWFDCAGASGASDDRINSTHDVLCDEELSLTVIQEILEKATNPTGYQGFDMYETALGVLIGHLRSSSDFVSPVTDLVPRNYLKNLDLHRVRNKQTVYGAFMPYPIDESWTETETNHTGNAGTVFSWNADHVAGALSLQAVYDDSNQFVAFDFTEMGLDPNTFRDNCRSLKFWLKFVGHQPSDVWLSLGKAGVGFWYTVLGHALPQDEWLEFTFNFPQSNWSPNGVPSWEHIDFLKIEVTYPASEPHTLRIDGLAFERRCLATNNLVKAATAASIVAYGVREAKPIVDDALRSYSECLARSESVITVLVNPLEGFEDMVTDGNLAFNPGDLQEILVANDAIHAYYRMAQVTHTVIKSIWDSTLTIGNEPQRVDYVMKLLSQNSKVLERTIGKF